MKTFSAIVFCAVLFHAQAELIQFGLNSVDYSPNSGKVAKCYEINCPAGTSACSKLRETSDDLQVLTTTYKCENSNGDVLYSETEDVENPYPGVKIQGFSYSSVYHVTGNTFGGNSVNSLDLGSRKPVPDEDRYNYNRNNYDTNSLDSQVEVFA